MYTRVFTRAYSTSRVNFSSSSSSHSVKVLRTISEVRSVRASLLSSSSSSPAKKLGFIPTMGALHEGHAQLVKTAKARGDVTMASIFVNPTQFLPGEDLASYPRTLDSDLSILSSIGTDYVFVPSVEEMYPTWPNLKFFVDVLGVNEETYEGRGRPGHFKGVATVVHKLFNAVQPTDAYFGQKDGMQCIVINRLVREMLIPVNIHIVPTVRANDGLALSSRNVYLSKEQREKAPVLFQSLKAAQEAFRLGERNVKKIKDITQKILDSETIGQPLYVSMSSASDGVELKEEATLNEASPLDGPVLPSDAMLSIAYKMGQTRLIDNCILGRPF